MNAATDALVRAFVEGLVFGIVLVVLGAAIGFGVQRLVYAISERRGAKRRELEKTARLAKVDHMIEEAKRKAGLIR